MKKIKAYVINHGHMDIEWYQPLSTFGEWFADSLRQLEDIVAKDPDYTCYTFDGATFPIIYVKKEFPWLSDTIEKLIAADKLKLGPFYTQFDEFLISGETIIKNCLWGDRKCRELSARPMKAGYLLDNFGHPAQLPQILNQFGIRSLFFSRGMCDIGDNVKEFIFRAPDGSEVVAQNFSYGTSFKIYENNSPRPTTPNRIPYYHDTYSTYEYLTDLSKHVDHQGIATQLIEGVKNAVRFYPSGIVPLFVGADHCPPQEGLTKTLALANAIQDEIEFIFTDAQELSELLNENKDGYVSYSGDLLGCKFDRLLFGANTARIYLKQKMHDCERLLFDYAIPLAAYAKYFGFADHQRELDEATELLLINSTHDSIHGCSLDSVHRENESRFDRISQLCARSIHRAMRDLSTVLWAKEDHEELVVYSPKEYHGYVRATLLTDGRKLTLTDSEGKIYPCVTLPRTPIPTNAKGEPYYLRPEGESTREIAFRADLKAGEVKKFAYRLATDCENDLTCTSETVIENQHYRLWVQEDGIFLLDHATGQTLNSFLRFTEDAETGDTFDHSFPFRESRSYSSEEFGFTEVSTLRCSAYEQLQTTCTMRVPLTTTGDLRSDSLVDLPIRLCFTLWQGVRRLEINVRIQNYARNHRVRLEFTLPEAFDNVTAGELFCAETFPVERPAMTEFWKEPPAKELPFRNWVSVCSPSLRYTLCAKGLYAFEPLDHKRIAFTLFRSVGELMRVHLQSRASCCMTGIPIEDAQCLREMSFDFSFVTHPCSDSFYQIQRMSEEFFCPPAVHAPRHRQTPSKQSQSSSFVPYEFLSNASLIPCAFGLSYDKSSFLLRFYDINNQNTTAKIDLSAFSHAYEANLNEQITKELPLQEATSELDVAHGKIVTLLLKK